jgi:hypothetical protein
MFCRETVPPPSFRTCTPGYPGTPLPRVNCTGPPGVTENLSCGSDVVLLCMSIFHVYGVRLDN